MNVTGLARCKKQMCCMGVLQGEEEAINCSWNNGVEQQHEMEQDCNATVLTEVLNMGDDKRGVINETSLYKEPQNNGDLPPDPSISVALYTRLNNGEPGMKIVKVWIYYIWIKERTNKREKWL